MRFVLQLLLLLPISLIRHSPVEKPPYFISMEYKGLSNCIYKVYVTDSLVYGAKVNGYITVEPSFGMGKTVPKSEMHDPEAFVDKDMDKYDTLLSDRAAFLKMDKANFIIQKTDIKKVYHNPAPKGGMGYYTHTGRLEIETIKTPEKKKATENWYWWAIRSPIRY